MLVYFELFGRLTSDECIFYRDALTALIETNENVKLIKNLSDRICMFHNKGTYGHFERFVMAFAKSHDIQVKISMHKI